MYLSTITLATLLSTISASPLTPNLSVFERDTSGLIARAMIWRSSDCSGEPAFQFYFDRAGVGCFEMHDVHSWMWEGTCNNAHHEIYESSNCKKKSKGVDSTTPGVCHNVGIPNMGWGSSGFGCNS
ncbi:hypothetical protein DE146DRAFT_457657 [Phaeosphaeria sp. MPI-PUGE-AT-0046c]|nr:hypothetical protein DE146DRAFT_457657 [Phaeosphaeria sp. MPI-PUGE-AT-0046c]